MWEPAVAVGQRIAELRTAKHLSREKLSRLADCSSHTVRRIEVDGHEPGLRVLRSIASALEVSVTELLSEDDGAAA
jgi:transcriptional regulator with XRE-family HTH domain